ncbi:Nif11-like leader peptide family natural product precursor [Rhizobium leguminosarum]|uniref:Nif11-like leader peptide family natural product precursor n=1 Tax=Rhizobium leguminosarum TaxID=384 RepID=UPI00103BC258|nr:Nif11-like leader peptide family natural product precursor [Rhizobium leguminosarum]MCA2411486.1 Nif11-like leader peptide family natural product precursor [Rhizobium leguminosarum]TBZ35881.1 Nif11 family protein [Rhizobium leguminosarum bv. viciae]TBZ73291.1 Nif11 family protein [Rhizobium leguminosarum bv. viciae]TBZ80478.1 Nif11 family protein [Rhizobium leguminosarum bv. viciae]TBZ94130.1 Nif11 family protein [Rhizobium leguminosarum bv. viciae]
MPTFPNYREVEVSKFAKALMADNALREDVKTNTTGLASLVACARKHGYDFTIDDAKNYTASADAFVEGEIIGQHHVRGNTVITNVAVEVVVVVAVTVTL